MGAIISGYVITWYCIVCNGTLDEGYTICNIEGMTTNERLQSLGLTQDGLARILSNGEKIEPRIRVKAHRIWHGQKPSDEEMLRIYDATNGKLDANFWHGLDSETKVKKRSST
jgi:hypothetical protein